MIPGTITAVAILEVLWKKTGIRTRFETTGAPGRDVRTITAKGFVRTVIEGPCVPRRTGRDVNTVRTVIYSPCTRHSVHGSGAVPKTTANEPKYSDNTTKGVQVNLVARDDRIIRTKARVP